MNEKQLFKSTWTRWALILGVASLAFNVILGFLGLYGNRTVGLLGLVISVVIIVAAFAAYKNANGGYLRFGRGVGMSALIGLLGGLIAGVLLLIYMIGIDPSLMDQMQDAQVEQAIEAMEKRDMPVDEDQLREQMDSSFVRNMTYGGILLGGPIFSCIWCVIVGLVAGAIMKNNPPPEHGHPVAEMGEGE